MLDRFSGVDLSALDHLPAFCPFAQCLFKRRPIMQSGWIKVCAIWPYKSVHFRIEAHPVEKLDVLEWRVQLACDCRLKVDRLNAAIVETDAKHIRPNEFKPCYFVNRMAHISILKDRSAPVFFLPAMCSNRPLALPDAIQPTLPPAVFDASAMSPQFIRRARC